MHFNTPRDAQHCSSCDRIKRAIIVDDKFRNARREQKLESYSKKRIVGELLAFQNGRIGHRKRQRPFFLNNAVPRFQESTRVWKKQSTSCGMEKKNNDEHDFEERRKYTRTREVRVVPRSAVIKTIIRLLFKIEKRKIRFKRATLAPLRGLWLYHYDRLSIVSYQSYNV